MAQFEDGSVLAVWQLLPVLPLAMAGVQELDKLPLLKIVCWVLRWDQSMTEGKKAAKEKPCKTALGDSE
jgi:hypothetical protein